MSYNVVLSLHNRIIEFSRHLLMFLSTFHCIILFRAVITFVLSYKPKRTLHQQIQNYKIKHKEADNV
jgi:hypothetical protein